MRQAGGRWFAGTLLLRFAAFGALRAALRAGCLQLTLLRAVSLLRMFASLRLRGQFLATSRDEAI